MLTNESSTWTVMGVARGSSHLGGWISVLTCRKYESALLLCSARDMQPGDLEQIRRQLAFFLLTGPDTHPAKGQGDTFYCQDLRKSARKGKHL